MSLCRRPVAWLRRSRLAELLLIGPELDSTEEAAFQEWARDRSARIGTTLLAFTTALVVLWWPTDSFVLEGNDAAIRLSRGWRLTYVGIAALAWILMVKGQARKASPLPLVTLTMMLLAALTFHTFARLVPLEAPWLHTSIVAPGFTIFLLYRPVPRLGAVLAIGAATWSSYSALQPFTHWIYWPHTTGVLVLSIIFSWAFGHFTWLFARRYFLTARRLEQQRARLRQVSASAALREERERRRIAADLHDGVAQDLGIAKLKLGSALTMITDPVRAQAIAEVRDIVDRSISETRRLMLDLSPPVLHELGLGAALESLSRRMTTQHDLLCHLETGTPEEAIGTEVSLFLFQAARELLTNVVKHAGVLEASIRLAAPQAGWVEISVHDEGNGFDLRGRALTDPDYEGFGLFSISDRAELLGGACEIASKEGEGTRITVRVPLAPPDTRN